MSRALETVLLVPGKNRFRVTQVKDVLDRNVSVAIMSQTPQQNFPHASPTIDQASAGGQQRVINFLMAPESHSPRPRRVNRIDTHAAIIFLTDDHAYKIKRAIQLPYLDFRELDERHRVCRRELELNKPSAPDIYNDIIPVVELPNGDLQLGGEGRVVEWTLKMRRFDQANILDEMACREELDPGIMHRLAETLVTSHANAPVATRHDGVSALENVGERIASTLVRSADLLDPKDVCDFRDAIFRALEQIKSLLAFRAATGFVRRCHGDVHLRNIVVLDDEPTLFDALEFDEEMATVDILYDLAFLLMDLWYRGLKSHANALFNRYIYLSANTFSPQALQLLPVFLSLRAAIRAVVALDSMPFLDTNELEGRKIEADNYLRLANHFIHPPKPMLIAIGGLSGTGKSTQANGIAPDVGAAPGAYVLRSDVERKVLLGVSPETHLDKNTYTPELSELVYEHVRDRAATALIAGHAVIADAVFSSAAQRDAIRSIAAHQNVRFIGIWLEASEDVLLSRVAQRTGDASDADVEVLRAQLSQAPGAIDWHRIDASGTADAVASRIRSYLEECGLF